MVKWDVERRGGDLFKMYFICNHLPGKTDENLSNKGPVYKAGMPIAQPRQSEFYM
jgi:hypothetical protein